MTPSITVEQLTKHYQVHQEAHPARYRTLRETLMELARRPWHRRQSGGSSDPYVALRDVSFEVERGDVLGIIGHNGAGKSTLLKILSRITRPTKGRVTLRGRVGTLLEVGTGFHPELTGRENIFLNGSILGMSRREIQRRFHDIVAFAEIEQFLDLPVKRYSSGMYVRLAFAVAAHLEPEILLVDEVLAVGDAAFQNRCLKKMGEFCYSGRTILFVSHNLSSIRTLCRQAIVMRSGQIVSRGPAGDQVAVYLAALAQKSQQQLDQRSDREGTGRARLLELNLRDTSGNFIESILAGSGMSVALQYRLSPGAELDGVALSFWSIDGTKMFHADTSQHGVRLNHRPGTSELVCNFPRLPLAPGSYQINALLAADGGVADHVSAAGSVTILPGDFFGSGRPTPTEGGVMLVDHEWRQEAG